jgi:hypothetical protein
VNHGLHALQIFHLDMTKVFGEGHRRRSAVAIECTFFVKASVQANDFMALPDQLRR